MAFQVANGSIPETVERWLRDELHLCVFCATAGVAWCLGHPTPVTVWEDDEARLQWGRTSSLFSWPHDREPTLQEAIEAVMGQRD